MELSKLVRLVDRKALKFYFIGENVADRLKQDQSATGGSLQLNETQCVIKQYIPYGVYCFAIG